ncbi:MAG: hypothetical protein QOD83_4300, partial [Solirubrobacteraceae bacterium]|nr:hypothetical protein [Solirubrobacteraceae bacterium]
MDSAGRRDTAYVHRNMLTMLRATAVWETNAPAAIADGLVGWTKQVVATIAPHTANESYQSFPNRGIRDW